jgi:NAD(P) transhydrogenase subunit alpha
LLVTADALKQMRAGSVIIEVGASTLGGNVEGSKPNATVVTDNGVTVVGAGSLAASVPAAASVAYSHNIAALVLHCIHEGRWCMDLHNEIDAGVVITQESRIVHSPTAAALASLAHTGGAS